MDIPDAAPGEAPYKPYRWVGRLELKAIRMLLSSPACLPRQLPATDWGASSAPELKALDFDFLGEPLSRDQLALELSKYDLLVQADSLGLPSAARTTNEAAGAYLADQMFKDKGLKYFKFSMQMGEAGISSTVMYKIMQALRIMPLCTVDARGTTFITAVDSTALFLGTLRSFTGGHLDRTQAANFAVGLCKPGDVPDKLKHLARWDLVAPRALPELAAYLLELEAAALKAARSKTPSCRWGSKVSVDEVPPPVGSNAAPKLMPYLKEVAIEELKGRPRVNEGDVVTLYQKHGDLVRQQTWSEIALQLWTLHPCC